MALCSSYLEILNNISTTCLIHYGTDPTFANLSLSLIGQVNVPFDIPLLVESTMYYFQISVAINSSLVISLQDDYTTGKCHKDENLLKNNIMIPIIANNQVHDIMIDNLCCKMSSYSFTFPNLKI